MPESSADVRPELSTAQPPYAPAAEPGPMPFQPVPPETGPTVSPPLAEEEDIWWGSYSTWTMIPSLVVCVLLTGLIAWGAWRLVPHGFLQTTVIGLAGAVWLVQGVRWGYRVFGYNYRLTTRRVFADRGFLYQDFAALELNSVAQVLVKRKGLDLLLGVGQVWIVPEDRSKPALVLEGVRDPGAIAVRLRELVQVARPPRGQEIVKS